MLWCAVLAAPQKGTATFMISGYATVHWNVWAAPIDHPRTAKSDLIFRCFVTSSCCARQFCECESGESQRRGLASVALIARCVRRAQTRGETHVVDRGVGEVLPKLMVARRRRLAALAARASAPFPRRPLRNRTHLLPKYAGTMMKYLSGFSPACLTSMSQP